jgi:hypothetical protein
VDSRANQWAHDRLTDKRDGIGVSAKRAARASFCDTGDCQSNIDGASGTVRQTNGMLDALKATRRDTDRVSPGSRFSKR